ncbi:MAG TPA: sialidase family protein, partial [Terriglobales bacterium]|nr:sialidase family protein [Terriglobales bacterium]
SWLQNSKSSTVVAKSTDFGQTWSLVVANRIAHGVDKDVLAVRGNEVYVAYSQAQHLWVSVSHDGGQTFAAVSLNSNPRLRSVTAGGGTIDPAGNIYFAWAGFRQREGLSGPVNLYLSKSSDGGGTWQTTLLDSSTAPPSCSDHKCGWAFLGAQMALTSDAAGTLYALWNSGRQAGAAERIYFASSTTGGASWSARQDVSSAPLGVEHAFPAITAGVAGDVRISWMDTRSAPYWNTFYRSSTNGGASWSEETRISSYVAGYSYISPAGFSFPFGDYFQMAIDDLGRTHVVWGEGLNWNTPGSVWYVRGR